MHVGDRLDPIGRGANVEAGRRCLPRHRSPVRERQEHADGRSAAARVQVVAEEGVTRGGSMNWLGKEKPTHYGVDALVKDKKAGWGGVRNPLAQKDLPGIHKGDPIFSHPTRAEKAGVWTP